MFIDCDHAKKLRVDTNESNEVLETTTYMSRQRLAAWHYNESTNQDIRDDIESAYWVMILEYLEIAREKDPNKEWPELTNLYSKDIKKVLAEKEFLNLRVEGDRQKNNFFLGPYKNIIQTIGNCILDLRDVEELEQLDSQLAVFWEKVFAKLDEPNPEWDSWDDLKY